MCEYELCEPEKWADHVVSFEQVRSTDGSAVTLVGGCHRCHHNISIELDIQGRTGDTVPSDYVRKPVRLRGKEFAKLAFCNCARDHDGRPENRAGCGAHGALHIAERNEKSRTSDIVGVTPNAAARPVMPDLEWEWRVQQQESEALPAMRAAGEKWTTAIASLTGVFGVVVLIKGPDDISGVNDNVGRWLPSLLPDAIWLVVLLAVAVAVALLALRVWRSLRPVLWLASLVFATLALLALGQGAAAWRTVVMVSLGVAVTFAGFSILAGARAAYGPIHRPVAPSGDLLRAQQRREIRHSRRWLLAAIYAAVYAILYIALAIAITWLKAR